MLSINLCSAEFVQSDTEESRELQAKLKDMNNHWDKLGGSLEEWRSSLQEALMQCQVGAGENEDSEGAVILIPNRAVCIHAAKSLLSLTHRTSMR